MNSDFNNLPALSNESRGKQIMNKIKSFFHTLCTNKITVSRTNEFFHCPILVFLIISILLWKLSIPVVLISLFCGVEYTLSGENFLKETKISFRPQN